MKPLITALVLTLILAGCEGVGDEQFTDKGITIADENMVKSCKFLGDVTGLSTFYGIFSGPAYSSARRLAIEQAQHLGATHVVFTQGSSHYSGTEVYGRAYKCIVGTSIKSALPRFLDTP